MNQLNKERIQRFMSDEVMRESVKEALIHSFMKKRDGDVQLKAAQMIALELLQEGWRELENMSSEAEHVDKKPKQIAV